MAGAEMLTVLVRKMRDGADLKILGELLSTVKTQPRWAFAGPLRPRAGSVSSSLALPSRQEAGPKQTWSRSGGWKREDKQRCFVAGRQWP